MAAELQGKYQKLAQEYSKLRAQNQVLKKAVLDEQANSAAVKEQLKMKEQSMRKHEQEMESLTFRNQQLAKRVELLQEELTVTEAKGKKSKKVGESVPQLSHEQKSVFDEDLRKKIEENERLHMQFFEVDEKHKRIEEELKTKLEVLEKEAAQHQAVLSGLTQKYMESIEKLQSEKAKLEIKSQTLEREAKDCRHRTEECQQQLKTLHVDLSSRLNKSLCIIAEKVPFNDIECSRLNALNVPLHNRRHQLKMRDLAGQALAFIQDFVKALLNFHTYTEQRVQIFPIDSAIDVISPLNQKFAQYLHENASYVRPLEEGMLHIFENITEATVTVLETTVKLKSFSEYLTSYMRFLQKILPYQLKSLEEECEFSLCTSNLRAKNVEVYNDMKKITSAFEKLQTYISLLALPSTNPEGLLRNNYSAIFAQISAALHGLNDVLKELSKHYTQKAALEQDLPTASEKLRTTNDCILSSLVSLTNAAGKISTFFNNNLDYFTSSLSYGPKGESGFMNPLSAECMLLNKKKAVAYMKTLKKPCPDSVPYKEALANRRVLLSSTESREGLSQQVQQSLEKLAKLEQEKEHWMLEAQLSKVKLEKENQRRGETLKSTSNNQLVELSQENSFLTNESNHSNDEMDQAWKDPIKSTSLIGMLIVSTENKEAPEADLREDLIKNHYTTRVVEITTQLQLADSKAVHFHAECRALAKRLAIADKSKEFLAEEIKSANQSISRLQDELTTTKRSYEDQLSMMSDHLCSMNETLSKQRDEIDALKMANKGISKKNKNR